jgi:hypothetical protein
MFLCNLPEMQAYERVGKKGPCLQVIIIEKIRAEE